MIPPGNGSTGLWEGRSYPALQPKKGTGLNPAGPALAKPHGHWGPSAGGDEADFIHTGFGTASARLARVN